MNKILIVDDIPTNLKMLSDLLEPEGYHILVAPSGEVALKVAARMHPDLILLDVMMPPGLDGFETCRRLKASPETANMPVIFVTAKGNTESVVQGFQAAGVDYISKPFEREEVLARVATHLKNAQLTLALKEKNRELEAEIARREHAENALKTLESQLEEYVKLREKLMASRVKVYSFLSVDVIHSVEMKQGVDLLLVQYSFMEYHKYIRENIEKHGGKINDTSGDGAMCSFNTAQNAIAAAMDIRNGLKEFNRTRNKLSAPFRIRFGIHTGSAVIDEAGKMDQMYTEGPDVAGHIQKQAGENEIIISETSYNEIASKSDFVDLNRKIDGFSIFRFNE